MHLDFKRFRMHQNCRCNRKSQLRLFVVPLELTGYLQLFSSFRRPARERLLPLFVIWKLNRGLTSPDFNTFKNLVWSSTFVGTSKIKLTCFRLTCVNVHPINAAPLWNFDAKFFHKRRHHFVTLCKDSKRRHIVDRSLLEIDDHQILSIHSDLPRQIGSR